jgi:hypothetical protein
VTRARDVSTPTALVLISSTTIGSAVTSVTVNNAFSATYDAYKIVITAGSGSGNNNVFAMQLGSTTTNYNWVLTYAGYASGNNYVRGSATNNFNYLGNINIDGMAACIEIQNPFLTRQTWISAPYADTVNTGILTGYQNSNTSFTGFTLTGSTFTGGTIKVYGYK